MAYEAANATYDAANVAYEVSNAESCPSVSSGSVDLLTLAQTVHWFDLGRFYSEARRVLN